MASTHELSIRGEVLFQKMDKLTKISNVNDTLSLHNDQMGHHIVHVAEHVSTHTCIHIVILCNQYIIHTSHLSQSCLQLKTGFSIVFHSTHSNTPTPLIPRKATESDPIQSSYSDGEIPPNPQDDEMKSHLITLVESHKVTSNHHFEMVKPIAINLLLIKFRYRLGGSSPKISAGYV